MRSSLVALAALCAGCGHTAVIRPADVPRLAAVDRGETVTVHDTDGYPVEISRYKTVTLFAKGGGGYVLRRPIKAWHERGVLWLDSASYAPIPFDPARYSRAEVSYSYAGDIVILTVAAGVAGVAYVVVLMAGSH